MSEQAPFRQNGNVGWAYAPTMGKFRGLARGKSDRDRQVNILCRHEHPSPESAMTCAAKILRAATYPGELIDAKDRARILGPTLNLAYKIKTSWEREAPVRIAELALGRYFSPGGGSKAADWAIVHQIEYAKAQGWTSEDLDRQRAGLGASL